MPPEIVIPAIDLSVIAPMLTIFAWATVLLMVDLFMPGKDRKLTGYLALAGLAVTALVTLAVQPAPGTSRTSFSDMVVLDSFGTTLTLLLLLIAAFSIAISVNYLSYHNIEMGEYYPLVLFATGAMILLGQSTNLILVFLGIELLSITLYVLTAFFYPRYTSEEAGLKYLLLGAFAAGFLIYGIALIYGGAGTLDLFEIGAFLNTSLAVGEPFPPGALLVLIGGALVLIGFCFKISLVPFHMWTPDVYEGSPTPVAAFMSVGTKGAAFAALLRILIVALLPFKVYWLPVLGVLATLTMLFGNIAALMQPNLKRMLAYSSVGHAGYITVGMMTAGTHGTESFLFYLLAYALANMGAFAVLITLERRGEMAWSVDDFAGLWKRYPLLAIAMATFMLSLAGVPPTAGFFGKFFVFAAAWEDGLIFLVFMGVLSSAIAAFFYLRVIIRMFMDEPVREVTPIFNRGLTITIGIAVVGTIVFGLLPTPLVSLVQNSVIALGVGG